MNHGEWIGSKIHESNKMLILGESHYGDENGTNESMGKPVPSIALQKDIESHQCLYFFVWPDSNPGFEVSAPVGSIPTSTGRREPRLSLLQKPRFLIWVFCFSRAFVLISGREYKPYSSTLTVQIKG